MVEVQKSLIFEMPNKNFISGKVRLAYIHTYIDIPVYKMSEANTAAQPVSIFRTKLCKVVKKCKNI